jgi:hypothetical protein
MATLKELGLEKSDAELRRALEDAAWNVEDAAMALFV